MTRTLTPDQVKQLLSDLCVDLGFCSLGNEYDRLVNSPPDTVDAFTEAVIVAEGLSPNMPVHVRESVRQKVAEHFRAAGLDTPE